jgi:RNA polymerase subunit RPABC4/transcription elongation factor Spt4
MDRIDFNSCHKCGRLIRRGAEWCPKCGAAWPGQWRALVLLYAMTLIGTIAVIVLTLLVAR